MPVVAACRCGQQFLAEDFLIGKQVPCPRCGSTLAIQAPVGTPSPATPRPQVPAASAAPASSSAGVAISCTCGSQFLVPESMRGKAGRCGTCGAVVNIPAARPRRQPPPPQRAAYPRNVLPAAASPLRPADPLAVPAHRPLPPSPVIAPAATSDRTWLVVGIAVGGGVLALGILIALVASSLGGGKAPAGRPAGELLVQNPANQPPPAPPVAPPRAIVAVAPSAQASSPRIGSPVTRRTPSTTSASPNVSSNPSTNIAAGSASTPATSTASQSRDPGQRVNASLRPGRSANTSGEHSIVQLPAGLQAWHGQPKIKLAGILAGGDPENPVTHLSWMTSLLPHLGYVDEYNRLDLGQPITHAANLRIGHTVILEFQNPLDSRKTWEGYPFHGLALTHFVGMSGVEDARNVCAAQLPRSDPRAGVFGYSEVARPADITDGASQTIMIVGGGRLASPWLLGGGATIRGAREPLFDSISGLGAEGMPDAGTLVVMADGSVRTVPKSIDPRVFRAMCTIHGAETFDLEAAAPELPVESLRPAGR